MSNPALAADVLTTPIAAVPDVSPLDCPFAERSGQHEIEKKADGSFWCELCEAGAENLEDLASATVRQLQAEEALRSGEASRSTERAPSETAPSPSWKAATEKLRALGKNSDAAETEPLLRELAASVEGQDRLSRALAREDAIAALKGKFSSPAKLVDGCLDAWIEARLRTSTSDPGPEAA